MPLSEKDRRIAYGILKHLRSQLDKGVVEGDPSESVEGNSNSLPQTLPTASYKSAIPV